MTLVSLKMLGWIFFTTAAVWVTPRKLQIHAIIALAAVFLAVSSPVSLIILCMSAAATYIASRRGGVNAWISALFVIAALAWFKTGDRFGLSGAAGIAVPLGLSFYALRSIHYIIESRKGTLPSHSFTQYACYLIFMPTLVAGPINRFQEFHRDLCRRRWDAALFSKGCERTLYGYAKIVILGNYLVSQKISALILSIGPSHGALKAYLGCVTYGANLYFQFSGYSDVAVGFSLMMGLRVMENFNYPFLAKNISGFWRRWHISLTNWCRDYIFMPAVSFTRQPWAAIIASMLVLGLWHEISWRYFAWGLYHGAGIALWRAFQEVKGRLPQVVGRGGGAVRLAVDAGSYIITMNFVLLSFAITKEPDMKAALNVYRAIFFFWEG